MFSSKSIFLSLQPFTLKIQKETSSRFDAVHEIRGLSGRLMTSLDFVPMCEKVQIWLKWELVLQSSAYWLRFARVLRCAVSQLAVCMLCAHHTWTPFSFTLCVEGSACKAGCQHLCTDKEVKGESCLPKHWHLVLLLTFFGYMLLLYLLFWYFRWSPPSCLPNIHFFSIVKMPLELYFKEANWIPKLGYHEAESYPC